MARNQAEVLVNNNDWYELTNADATTITWQIVENYDWANYVYIRVTDDATKPTEQYGLRFSSDNDPEVNRALTAYRGGAGTPKRVWAKASKEPVVVLVSDNSL